IGPKVRIVDTSTTRLPPRQKDPHYGSAAHRTWARAVLDRAGHRCEFTNGHGIRCSKGWPDNRLFADHIVELRDGGSAFDPSNGQALWSEHQVRTSHAARADRWS